MGEQTTPGVAVYLLNSDLRVPGTKDPEGPGYDLRPRWVAKGSKAGADELTGLVIPALEAGGFVQRVAEPKVPCEACQTDGTAAEKKARYSLAEIRAHYAEKHRALSPPEGEGSG